MKYSLKKMFKERVGQDENWISNGHFVFNKSILTPSQRKQVEELENNIDITKIIDFLTESKRYIDDLDEPKEFVPELIHESAKFNTLVNETIDLALNEEYYNLFTDRKCKIYKGKDGINPTGVYKGKEFVGVLLPVKSSSIDILFSYEDYLKKQQEVKNAKKAARETLKEEKIA